MASIPLSVQLYTLRDLVQKDFAAAVQEVARIGYPAVELAGYGNLKSPTDVKRALDDAGLKASGAHSTIESLEDDLNNVLDAADTLGTKYVICPYLPEPRRKTGDDYRRVAATLNRVGEACRGRGITFAYHNHSFEFQKFEGGRTGMDLLWSNTDPRNVKAELDVYWLRHGGADPVAYINELGDRVVLLHLKDMARGDDRRFAEVGTGLLDFNGILAAAEKHGVAWGVVEQDNTYGTPPLEAIRTSFENLKKITAA